MLGVLVWYSIISIAFKKIDFRLFDILLHSEWDVFTTSHPILIGPLDPHSSRLHIRGNARYIRGFILVAITD